MTKFKLATHSDIPFIVYLLEEFYGKWDHLYKIPFVREDCEDNVQMIVEHGICLVGPTSCAGALLQPFIMNNSVKVALAHFWYFQNAREIKIFESLIAACKQAGATHLSAASHFPEFVILKYYAKLGLLPQELYSMVKL